MNRDKAITLGTWLKIHTNISHLKIVSPETISTLKEFYVSFFEIGTAVTKLTKRFNSLHVLGGNYSNMLFCSEKVLKK